MAPKNVEDVNLYAVLDVPITATESEIKKAYRKKALKCHPDKNPDDPKAAETFHALSQALEILTDVTARAAYDKVLRAKAVVKIRHQELDSLRQKQKEVFQKLAAEMEKLKRAVACVGSNISSVKVDRYSQTR